MDAFIMWLRYKKEIIIAVVLLAPLLLGAYFIFAPVNANDTTEISVDIKQGSGLYQISQILKDLGLIRSKYIFTAYVTFSGDKDVLKAGRYILSPSMSIPKIAAKISGGLAESDDISVVIPEGYNIWEIDKELAENDLIEEGEFAKLAIREEGYAFPDTYRFDPEVTAAEILQKMKENFKDRAGDTDKEIIITASILEKEVKTEEDMRLVAGIIKERMKRGMPLQIDATVAYGACLKNFQFSIFNFQKVKNCDVTFVGVAKEIKIDSSYNTYTRPGLPAGPISNPGSRAIGAAKNPKSSDYLYYLSAKDGTTIFSKTAQEHAQNRKKYLGL